MAASSLLDSLSTALSTLPGKHSYSVQVVRSSPRRSHALFPHASNQSTKIWQEEVLVLLSEAITTTDAAASTPTTRALPISAIEASIYTIPSTSTSLVYISKVDTTGLSKSAPSPTRPLVAAFVAHLLEHPPHATRRVRIHIFARAQGQYLFPGSVDNKGKRVLDDKGLIRWWKGTISKAINSIPPSTSEPTTPTQLFYLVPGLSYTESLPYVPATPSPTWIYSHPYSQISSPLHLPSASSSPGPLHDHIPNFPDDPKSRFITSLTSSPIPPAGSPDDYDEVIHALHQRSFTSGSSSTLAASLEALEKERARERTRLVDGIPGGVEEYWERLAFRQECCSGQLVGFFVVVRDAPVDPLTIVKGQPKPESMAVEHAVFTRLWSQFHNSDYSEPAVGTLEPAARKWERDVEAITSGEGWVGEPAAEKEDEDEEKIRLKELRAKGYKDEVKRVVDVDNPVAPGGEKRPLEEKPEEKKVNVMVPRKKKKAT
ncbi:DNA damage response protein [Pseudohyphozyma bogoriensis]|nr:DNA damage response protein [Pseudohyphozyma bogoriensis]